MNKYLRIIAKLYINMYMWLFTYKLYIYSKRERALQCDQTKIYILKISFHKMIAFRWTLKNLFSQIIISLFKLKKIIFLFQAKYYPISRII